MEQTIKWVKGDRPEKEGWYLVCGTKWRDEHGEWRPYVAIRYYYTDKGFTADSLFAIEYYAEIIGPNGEKYE